MPETGNPLYVQFVIAERIGAIILEDDSRSRLLGVHQHEKDPASLSSVIDPCVIGGLLDDRSAGLEMNHGVIEPHLDLPRQLHRVIDAARPMHQRMGDRAAS